MSKKDGGSSGSAAMAGESMTAEMKNTRMSQDRAFLTKLFEAALRGEGDKLKQLVNTYSEEQSMPPQEVLSQFKDAHGRTALHFACQSIPESSDNDVLSTILLSNWLPKEAVQEIIDLKDAQGITPLMLAAQNPDRLLAESRVDTILNVGGDKLALDRSSAGATPLHYAAGAGCTPATIRRLSQAGKDTIKSSSLQGGTPLHWAAAGGPQTDHTETMKALVECGADVDATNEQGLTALILAAASVNDRHAKFLVHAGADCSKVLPGDITIFHMAADLNLVGTLAALLEVQESLAQDYCARKNANGETPLDLAAQEGNVGCVMMLLPEGANDEESATAYIKSHVKQSSNEEVATPKPPTEGTEKSVETETDADEAEAMRLAAEIAAMSISDQDKKRSLELKAEGNQHFSSKEWQKAIDSYTAAIELNPADATFYSNRSASYMMLGQPTEALIDAVIARQLRPNWSKACYRMAVARLELERYEDAALAAWEGLQQDQDNEELQCLLQKCVNKGKKVHRETLAKQKNENASP